MKFACHSGQHFFNSEEKADACPTCRRQKDTATRRHFKQISDKMLKSAGLSPAEEGRLPAGENNTKPWKIS